MSKCTTFFSDLRSFFSANENNRAVNEIMRVMDCINLCPDQVGTEMKEKCQFANLEVLNFLVRKVCRNYRAFVLLKARQVRTLERIAHHGYLA